MDNTKVVLKPTNDIDIPELDSLTEEDKQRLMENIDFEKELIEAKKKLLDYTLLYLKKVKKQYLFVIEINGIKYSGKCWYKDKEDKFKDKYRIFNLKELSKSLVLDFAKVHELDGLLHDKIQNIKEFLIVNIFLYNEGENVELKNNYSQVYVFPGVDIKDVERDEFRVWLKEHFGTDGYILEVVKTFPNIVDGYFDTETGGRSDIIFTVMFEDVAKFAVPRLEFGIRYIEDVFSEVNSNYESKEMYYDRLKNYRTW